MAFTNLTWQNSGTITGLNQSVTLDCPGAASAEISVTGTFVGTLTITGGGDLTAVAGPQGGRLVFKSGVGSLGHNKIIGLGTAIANDYRIVAGGRSLTITATSWTSGSATVKVTASQNPSILFVNGPVHTALEEAVRAGRAYSASTGMQSVNANNFLNYVFSNPVGSNVNVFVVERIFSSNITGTPPEYGLLVNPVALTSPTSVTPSNLNTGGGVSACTFNWKMQTTRIDTSPTTANPSGSTIPTDGMPREIMTQRTLTPGQSIGYYVGGAGGGLTATARLGMSLVWFEEPVN